MELVGYSHIEKKNGRNEDSFNGAQPHLCVDDIIYVTIKGKINPII